MDSLMPATTEMYDDPASILNPIIEPTTTESPMTTVIVNIASNALKTAAATIATTPSTMLNELNTLNAYPYQREHLEHNKITFQIPDHRDLEHIDSIHNFNTLLKRIGNAVTTFDASQFYAAGNQPIQHYQQQQQLQHQQGQLQLQEQLATNAEISKSVVLDLADLSGNAETIGLERFFGGADMHSIINYLWIGIVTSLIILSIIFIVFSCYFYRKFREWKKCNKHMREHLNDNIHQNNINNNNDINPMLYANGVGMVNTSAYFTQMSAGNKRTAYYQVESPPCYTIATGLPSYDEALLHYHQRYQQRQHSHHHNDDHHQQNKNPNQKQRNCFNYALKSMYSSTPAAIYQQQQQQQYHERAEGEEGETQHMDVIQQRINIADGHFMSKWKRVTTTAPSIEAVDNKAQQYCCNTDSFNVDHKNSNKKQQKKQQQQQQQDIKVSTLRLQQSPKMPPPYDLAAKAMLLNVAYDVESATPMLSPTETIDSNCNDMDNKIHICISDEKLMNRKEFFVMEMHRAGNNEAAETVSIIDGSSRTAG